MDSLFLMTLSTLENSQHPSTVNITRDHQSTRATMLRAAARLAERSVLRVSGADAEKYLQALVTSDVRSLAGSEGSATQFAAFLTPRGRMLCDVFVSRSSPRAAAIDGDPAFLIDVGRGQARALLKHLRHPLRLRGSVGVEAVDDGFGVWSLLDRDGGGEALASAARAAHAACAGAGAAEGGSIARDERSRHCGYRAVLPLDGDGARAIDASGALDDGGDGAEGDAATVYACARVLAGAAEGDESVGMIPLEANFAELGGIAFDKGCYLGQELIARTYHRGVVRKRLVPIVLGDGAGGRGASSSAALRIDALVQGRPLDAAPLAAGGDPVVDAASGKKVGKIVATVPGSDLALAMLRLEKVGLPTPRRLGEEVAERGEGWTPRALALGAADGLAVHALEPTWWGA